MRTAVFGTNGLIIISLGSYNFRAIFTHAWAGVTTLCSCKYFGNIDNPDPLMQYTNKKVITSIFLLIEDTAWKNKFVWRIHELFEEMCAAFSKPKNKLFVGRPHNKYS